MFTLLNIGISNNDKCATRYQQEDGIAKMYAKLRDDANKIRTKMALDELWSVRGCTMFEDQLKDVDWVQYVSADTVDNVKVYHLLCLNTVLILCRKGEGFRIPVLR